MQETRPESDSCDFEIQQEIPILEEAPPVVPVTNNNDRAYSSTKETAAKSAPIRNGKRAKECDLYGKLLSQKLMKLNEEDRLMLMNQIDNLVFHTAMRAMSQSKSRPPTFNIPSSCQVSPEDLKENYVIQMIKSSPPPESRDDPLD